MKKLTSLILSASFILGLGLSATAQTPVINNRERYQQKRIRRGVRNSELTRREAARLEAQQARIRRSEARAKRDGEVTRRERHRINRQLNRANRNIHRQKHDHQDRNP